MKRLVSIGLLLFILISVGLIFDYNVPAHAFTPPGQGTDNATDVILWQGDNVTLTAANVTITDNITITDLQVALIAAAEAQTEDIGEIADTVIGFILVLVFAGLAYWHRDRLLYIIAGLAFITYGFSYLSTSIYISILLVLLGAYSFLKAWLDRKEA